MAHVLVVEDELRLADRIERLLREEGHVVEVANDGDEGLTLGSASGFDAIVLDVLLPGIDGFTVCRRLRTSGVQTPVLMLTARDAVEDRVAGLDAGADDYLTKPFAFEELLARIRALTRRAPVIASSDGLVAADLKMDLVKREVTRGGRVIPLTNKEFALLEYFLRHPNQVLSRSQILDNVWGYDAETDSGSIEYFMHHLRRKIGDEGPSSLLRTVRGIGYALRTAED